MKKLAVFVFLIPLVLFISGCVEGGGLGGLMGVGTEEVEEPDDVLVIRNQRVDPSTVNAEGQFEFSFELTNLFDAESARNVEVRLYDSGMCDLRPGHDPQAIDGDSIFEGATRVIEWGMDAPTDQELGHMAGSCPLKYYVKYEFDAYSRSDVYVMDEDVSRDSEVASVSPTTGKARGPVKVDIDFSGQQPFRSGSAIPFQVRLRNAGDGSLDDLTPRDVSITLDYGETEKELGYDEYLDEETDWKTGCRSPVGDSEELQFIDGRTPPISCRLYPDGYSEYFEEPLSSFQIRVNVEDYEYTLEGEGSVSIQPTL